MGKQTRTVYKQNIARINTVDKQNDAVPAMFGLAVRSSGEHKYCCQSNLESGLLETKRLEPNHY